MRILLIVAFDVSGRTRARGEAANSRRRRCPEDRKWWYALYWHSSMRVPITLSRGTGAFYCGFVPGADHLAHVAPAQRPRATNPANQNEVVCRNLGCDERSGWKSWPTTGSAPIGRVSPGLDSMHSARPLCPVSSAQLEASCRVQRQEQRPCPAAGRKHKHAGDRQGGERGMIPDQWLPPLPLPANGWLPVYYEVSEDSGILRQGEYRVDGERVWARNDVGVRFLPREKGKADVAVARQVLHLLERGM